jgi:ParB-like chromosome segregation protein Spo0J
MGLEGNTQTVRPEGSTGALVPAKQAEPARSLSYPVAVVDEAVLSPAWIESHPVTMVSIDSLVFDGSPRMGGEDPEHIRLLAEASGPLPPIAVHWPTMRVIDGIHRVRAALLKNLSKIEARLLHCDENAAFVLAVKANVTHGLPLSQADRTAAAVRIITCHPHWSDRAVAAATGLSDKTISRIRGRLVSQVSQPPARLGRDGRLRPLDTGSRRQQAAVLIGERPGAGLREVARATGLSVATVRDVRQRIGRGEDPVPGRYRSAGKLDEPEPPAPAEPECPLRPRRTRYKEAPADRRTLLAKLRHDPSLRFSEAGRHLLHWLHRHTVDTDGLESICHGLPDHWAPVVAELARTCATAWTAVAEQLEQRTVE